MHGLTLACFLGGAWASCSKSHRLECRVCGEGRTLAFGIGHFLAANKLLPGERLAPFRPLDALPPVAAGMHNLGRDVGLLDQSALNRVDGDEMGPREEGDALEKLIRVIACRVRRVHLKDDWWVDRPPTVKTSAASDRPSRTTGIGTTSARNGKHRRGGGL